MLPGSHKSLAQNQVDAPTERSTELVFVVDALKSALQIAFEAAIFPDRFEIDEQQPLSRLEALTEQLLDEARSKPGHGKPDAEEAAGMAATISIISEIDRRIRTAIR